jgi:hypothetical protein
MILECMAVYDNKARAYLPPFYVSQVDVGIRHIADAVNSADHPFSRNPDDYQLFHLGAFSDDTGAHAFFQEARQIGIVSRWKRS